MRKFLMLVLTTILALGAFGAAAQDDMMMDMDVLGTTILPSVDADGAPEENWLDAWGFAIAHADEDGNLVVDIYANNLVPEGVYTLWGVNMGMVGMQVAPAGGAEANAFTASEDGDIAFTVTVGADESYEMLAVAYHSDGQTYGDEPGAMGEVTFTHLMGAFPGMEAAPAAEAAVGVLPVVTADGVPANSDEEAWSAAVAVAQAVQTDEGFEVTIYAANLIPDGLYTNWAVNMGLVGMDVAPAGGTPANEFRADANGFGANTILIPADAVPDALALAYHSDDMTYGDVPGPMGEVTFTHLMGEFPALMAE